MHLFADGPHIRRFTVLKVLLDGKEVQNRAHELNTDEGWVSLFDTDPRNPSRKAPPIIIHGIPYLSRTRYFGKLEVLIQDRLSRTKTWYGNGPNVVEGVDKFPFDDVLPTGKGTHDDDSALFGTRSRNAADAVGLDWFLARPRSPQGRVSAGGNPG